MLKRRNGSAMLLTIMNKCPSLQQYYKICFWTFENNTYYNYTYYFFVCIFSLHWSLNQGPFSLVIHVQSNRSMEIQFLRMCLNVTSSSTHIIKPYEDDKGITFTPHPSSNHTIQGEGGNFQFFTLNFYFQIM